MEAICTVKRPNDFHPKFQKTACILKTAEGQVLFLLHNERAEQALAWDLPVGEMNVDEAPSVVTWRKTKELTGIVLEHHKMQRMPKIYVKYPVYDFIFHMYKYEIPERIGVRYDINKYQDFRWMYPKNAVANLQLAGGLDDCLNYCLGLSK